MTAQHSDAQLGAMHSAAQRCTLQLGSAQPIAYTPPSVPHHPSHSESDPSLWLQRSFQAESTRWDAHHAGDLDRQQLWQRSQEERPGSASRQQQQQQQPADNVRFEDLDIYIVSPAATSPPS